jgi:streptomycin 6-kinase
MTDAITGKLVRRFGESVTSWTAGLPDLVTRFAARWDLAVGETFASGASSVAIRVTTADGTGAVLKLSPDLPFMAEQVAVLRLFEPTGRVPRVLADDAGLGAVLMTEIRPGTPVHELAAPPTPAEFAGLLTALHGATLPPPGLPPPGLPPPGLPPPGLLPRDLRQWTDEFTHRAMDRLADPAIGAHLSRADFALAQRARDRLFANPAPTVLLHGDLHLGNVLAGEHGLVAIDPKACVGDPCFDAIDYVTGGAGRRDGVRYRLDALSAAGGLDRDRVLGWCEATMPVVVLPLLSTGRHEAAAELLALLRT